MEACREAPEIVDRLRERRTNFEEQRLLPAVQSLGMQLDAQAKKALLVLVALAVGGPLFLVGAFANVESIWFRSKAAETEARISNVLARGTDFPWGRVYTYDYGLEFRLREKAYNVNASSRTRYDEGSWVPVLYDAANPERVRIDDSSREWFFNAVCFIPGLALLIGAGLIVYRIKQGI